MSVHSLPGKRPSSDGAGTRPAAAIRRTWVRAITETALPDLDNSHTADVDGETRPRRAA